MDGAFNVVCFVFEAPLEDAFNLGAHGWLAQLFGNALDVARGHFAHLRLTKGNHGVGFHAAQG
jgi:hypothetical protein